MKSHKEYKTALTLLGNKIYTHRVLKNLTTKEIAAAVSLTPQAFRNIEKGESDPSYTTLLLISETLQIDCSELFKPNSIQANQFGK